MESHKNKRKYTHVEMNGKKDFYENLHKHIDTHKKHAKTKIHTTKHKHTPKHRNTQTHLLPQHRVVKMVEVFHGKSASQYNLAT